MTITTNKKDTPSVICEGLIFLSKKDNEYYMLIQIGPNEYKFIDLGTANRYDETVWHRGVHIIEDIETCYNATNLGRAKTCHLEF